ncbi:MAG: hypothetical protein IJK99_02865 [Bacteroidales bacterium]|nr:hypothetical protein [Bacteroidales bacterium]
MEKNILKTFAVLTALATTLLFNSCNEDPVKPEDNNSNNTTEISFENPRFMAEDNGNIYVTSYFPLGVARFDISQMKFTGFCKFGQFHPEGIAAVGGKLYIASSSISDENYNFSYDNKLYVVDIATFTLVDSITVGLNPQLVKKLDDNHIVFNTWGNYTTDFGGTYIMNTDTKEIVDLHQAMTKFDVCNGYIYGYATTYNADYTTSTSFFKVNGTTHEISEILSNFSATDGVYGINVNPANNDIVVLTDGTYTTTGDCYVYTADGQQRIGATAMGNLPSKAVAIDADNLLVLNEGGWGKNNAGISRVNVASGNCTPNFFADNNGRGLGDVAQDLIIAGGKAYATVTFSNSLEVMDPATGKSTRIATTK